MISLKHAAERQHRRSSLTFPRRGGSGKSEDAQAMIRPGMPVQISTHCQLRIRIGPTCTGSQPATWPSILPPTNAAESAAEDEAELEDEERPGQPFRPEIVGEQRIGAWPVGGAADADEHAAAEELPEALGEPTDRGHAAGDDQAETENGGAAVDVDETGERNADDHVEEDAGRAEQQPKLLSR